MKRLSVQSTGAAFFDIFRFYLSLSLTEPPQHNRAHRRPRLIGVGAGKIGHALIYSHRLRHGAIDQGRDKFFSRRVVDGLLACQSTRRRLPFVAIELVTGDASVMGQSADKNLYRRYTQRRSLCRNKHANDSQYHQRKACPQ